MICSKCNGSHHILVDGVNVRCDCLKQIRIDSAIKCLGGSHSEAGVKGKKTLDIVTERYASLQRPKVPLLVFGSPVKLIDFSIDMVSSILSVLPVGVDLEVKAESLHELIDLYFKDSKTFILMVSSGLFFIRMGAEVANQGCIKTVEAILHRFTYNRLYPVFQSSSPAKKFFQLYPPELKDVFNMHKISIVEL